MTKTYNQINYDKKLRDYYNKIRNQCTDDAFEFMIDNISSKYDNNEFISDKKDLNKRIRGIGHLMMFIDMGFSLKLISRASNIWVYNLFTDMWDIISEIEKLINKIKEAASIRKRKKLKKSYVLNIDDIKYYYSTKLLIINMDTDKIIISASKYRKYIEFKNNDLLRRLQFMNISKVEITDESIEMAIESIPDPQKRAIVRDVFSQGKDLNISDTARKHKCKAKYIQHLKGSFMSDCHEFYFRIMVNDSNYFVGIGLVMRSLYKLLYISMGKECALELLKIFDIVCPDIQIQDIGRANHKVIINSLRKICNDLNLNYNDTIIKYYRIINICKNNTGKLINLNYYFGNIITRYSDIFAILNDTVKPYIDALQLDIYEKLIGYLITKKIFLVKDFIEEFDSIVSFICNLRMDGYYYLRDDILKYIIEKLSILKSYFANHFGERYTTFIRGTKNKLIEH